MTERIRVDADLNWRHGSFQKVLIEDIPVPLYAGMKVLFVADDETRVPGTILEWDDERGVAWGSYDGRAGGSGS